MDYAFSVKSEDVSDSRTGHEPPLVHLENLHISYWVKYSPYAIIFLLEDQEAYHTPVKSAGISGGQEETHPLTILSRMN